MDLRRLVLTISGSPDADYSVLKSLSPGSGKYEAYEAKIADICRENGVIIAPGHVYMAEEYGWFRLTFTLEKNALREGLKRLVLSLDKAGLNKGQ